MVSNLALALSRPVISTLPWDCVRQDALLMWFDIIFGRLATTIGGEIAACCISFLNCADPAMLQYMQSNVDRCNSLKGEPKY